MTPVMRQIHKAGEKTFVDYAGMKMLWLNPQTGEIHVTIGVRPVEFFDIIF